MIKIALAGNPNCGKTTLFNALTGSTAHVGNWPGVTVDKREGVYKKGDEPVKIVDLPGIYSLSPYTPEEVIARNYLLDETPDCVINIVDSTNLERNLYLTTQLLELDVAVVIALNMTDEIEKDGGKIDAQTLSQRLGVPVIKISALKSVGLTALMQSVVKSAHAKRKANSVVDGAVNQFIGKLSNELESESVSNSLFHAVKLAESDELEIKAHKDKELAVNNFKKSFNDNLFGDDVEAYIADARYKYVTKACSGVVTSQKKNKGKEKLTPSDKADKVLTHKIWGIPIFLLVLFAVFHLTFSGNFLFLGAALPADWVSLEGTAFEGVFGEGGIASPGVILQNFLVLGTDTLKNLAASGLESVSAASWVSGFLVDGVLEGLFAILSFIPQILLLFLFFSILEDSGYMARIAFILDRIFRKFGLSGRAFMPMIMGFGCSVPAMINTRTLADDNERTATIRVIPFFSCGAKLPILTAVAGAMAVAFGIKGADFITYGMYLLGIIVAIASVLFMRSTSMRGETPPFIMELPSYRAPQFKNLMIHLWDKLKHFIKKAFTIILASTIFIWFISHFSFSWQFLADEQMNESILGGIGQLVQPIFTPLGFGSQLGSWGWVFAVAAFMGLIAKENVISAFGTLAACIVGAVIDIEADGGVGAVTQMITATGATKAALISFIAFNMLTIPCFAAVATAKAELGSKKRFNFTILFWLATSYFVSSAIYVIGSWWWTSFIFAAVIAIAVVAIVIYNKKYPRRSL